MLREDQWQPISDMTVLGSELIVVGDVRQSLDAYNTISLTWTRTLEIPGSRRLLSVVACQHNNCLYISDDAQCIIYRCRFDRSKYVFRNWSVGGHCARLSVTRSYSVLVTLWDIKRVHEYTTDGSLITYISLDNSMGYPGHCIQLSSDRFVVSHGLLPTHQLCRVCIIDTSGHIIQSYGVPRGSDIGQMKNPCNMVVDKHGHVMVADKYNNKVESLSPTLTHLGYIQIPGHELYSPRALHLDELNHRLYILRGYLSINDIYVLSANVSKC